MYDISTGQARTDLYGMGKGEAQVFDTSSAERAIENSEQRKFAKAQLKAKQEQDRVDDINNQLSAMGSVSIMPRDRELIGNKSKAVRDYVVKNIDSLRRGDDPAKMAEFQNLYGDLKTSAEMSKNARESWEQIGTQIAKDPSKYRPEATDYHLGFASKEKAGDWQYDATQLRQNTNYLDTVLNDLVPYADKIAKESPYGKTFTIEQAKNLIAEDLSNEVKFEQAAYDFNKAQDKLGAKDPIEFYQKKYANKLVIKDTKAGPSAEGSSNAKLPKVAGTYTDRGNGKGEFQFEYTDKADNPYLITNDPKTNQPIEIKPQKVVFDGKDTKLIVQTKPTAKVVNEDGTEKEAIPAKTMELDYNYVSDIMNNKFGIKNIYDIQNNNAPAHVTVKRSNVTDKQEVKSKSGPPQKGEEKAVKGGIAVFNGTKWEMKK